jgi:hypothetical protein
VEIEPDQSHWAVVNFSVGLVKVLSQSLLAPFLVYEVYESTIFIVFEDIFVILNHIAVESVVVRYRDF